MQGQRRRTPSRPTACSSPNSSNSELNPPHTGKGGVKGDMSFELRLIHLCNTFLQTQRCGPPVRVCSGCLLLGCGRNDVVAVVDAEGVLLVPHARRNRQQPPVRSEQADKRTEAPRHLRREREREQGKLERSNSASIQRVYTGPLVSAAARALSGQRWPAKKEGGRMKGGRPEAGAEDARSRSTRA